MNADRADFYNDTEAPTDERAAMEDLISRIGQAIDALGTR